MNILKQIPKDFVKIPKQRKYLEDNFDTPVVIILKEGLIISGNIDDYLYPDRAIAVYNVEVFKSGKWQPQNEWFAEYEGITFPDHTPYFDLDQIEVIYTHKNEELYLRDVQNLFINPEYKIHEGIKCSWTKGKNHSEECDKELHEALTDVFSHAYKAIGGGLEKLGQHNIERKKLDDSIELVTRKLFDAGYKIP
ncbi:MAG: hypothetical protein K0S93_27 [Nitrososphaeraceae archaeon]|jgi:hypothetical protein|nr:hypothetical protein [Nitrososphaeraceae archaeon]